MLQITLLPFTTHKAWYLPAIEKFIFRELCDKKLSWDAEIQIL